MDKNDNLTLNSNYFINEKRVLLPEIIEKNEEYINKDSYRKKTLQIKNQKSKDTSEINDGETHPILPNNMSDKMITESDLLSQGNLNSTLNNIRDEIKSICSKIFLNFAQFSKTEKEYFLSKHHLHKILKAIVIIDEKTVNLNEIDIIVKKITISGKRLNLNQFLSLIILVSKKIDKESFKKDPKTQVISIVKTFFEPYSKYIESAFKPNLDDTSNNAVIKNSIEVFLNNYKFDFIIITLINSIYAGLKDIYLAYFSAETKLNSAEKITPISLQGLLDFCKDFGVLPCFCSVNQIVIYWNVIIKMNPSEITKNNQYPDLIDPKKDLGQVFTLSKFSSMLIYLSVSTFYKYYVDSTVNRISYGEKLIFFLEKLENSNGFQTIEKKLNKFRTTNNSLIPPKDVLLIVNPSLSKESNFLDDKKWDEESKKLKQFNEKSKLSGDEGNDLRSLMSIIPEEYIKLEGKLEILKEIFINYCNYGCKINNQKLSFSSYLKFLRDCEIVYKPLSAKEIEMKKMEQKKYSNREEKDKSHDKNSKFSYKKEYKIKSFFDGENEFVKEKMPPVKKMNIPKGKILESDILVIFYNLTGHKNFDNSEKIKTQFDKNTGINVSIEHNLNLYSTLIDPSKSFKISNENSPLKMDFCLFIKSFEYLAKKIHPEVNLDQGFNSFLEEDLKKLFSKRNLNLFSDKTNIKEKWNSLKREEIVDILKDIHPLVFPFYETYCNTDALLNYEKFFEFYKDFNIFPEVLSLFQIKSLFFSLSDIYCANSYQTNNKSLNNLDPNKTTSSNEVINKTKRNVNSNKNINYDLFLESLAVTALTMKCFNNEYNDVYKILFLLEVIYSSEAIKNCKLKTGQHL